MLPFARLKAERITSNDPRRHLKPPLPLWERAGVRGYVNAAANAVAQKFLLQKDADALVEAAKGSGVLK